MRLIMIVALMGLLFIPVAFSQNSQAIITGTVLDPAGAGIRAVTVVAENADSGERYEAKTADTGFYVFLSLQPGKYRVSISLKGFKPYSPKEVIAVAARILRVDIAPEKEVPADADEEEATSAEEDALQRVEGSQWAHSVQSDTLKELPLLGFSAGQGRIRNPLYALQLTPDSLMTNLEYFRVSGAPSNTESIRIDGQEINNGSLLSRTITTQPGVEAVDSFTVQALNAAAEYGQAGSGVFSMALKSGTNSYHGSAYDYFSHEALNETQRYSDSKPKHRAHDYGFTLGGPLSIPGIYDGRNRTLFFLNFEQLRQLDIIEKYFTVPTLAFRRGDFRKALTGRTLGEDPLGRTIKEGAIYDPSSEQIIAGQRVRNPFPNNLIPTRRFDPVARAIQDLIPLPTDTDNSHITNNYAASWRNPLRDTLGSLKIDQKFSKSKLSFYFGANKESATGSPDEGGDGFTGAVTSSKPTDSRSHTWNVNYEQKLSSALIFNLGIGRQSMRWRQASAYGPFDAAQSLGLAGSNFASFPYITGLNAAMGGMKDMGANRQSLSKMQKTSAGFNLSWVRNKHIYKFGAELRFEGYSADVESPAYGSLNFSAEQTTLPSTYGQNLRNTVTGFPYASFLLGLVNKGDIGVVSTPKLEKHSWAVFAQDSWKVTRKLTLEYGVRYDYQTYLKEANDRLASFSPTALNPLAGDLPGAMVYEKDGDFAKIYPSAFGPRLGLAYQLTSKIVLRAGWGILYGQTATDNGATLSAGSTNPFYTSIYADSAIKLSDGFPSSSPWPHLDASQMPIGNGITPISIHPDAGKPPRQIQWNLSFQREIMNNYLLDIAYMGNQGRYWESNGLVNINALTSARLESSGLYLGNADDHKLLTSSLNSALALNRGFGTLPYAGFSANSTVAQSLRPFPQYGDIYYRWAPLGKTWYSAMQIKLSKKYSRGFAFSSGFSWQRAYAFGNENVGGVTSIEAINHASNATITKYTSGLSQPYTFFFAPTFTFPKFSSNRWMSMILRDWKFSAFLHYASGLPVPVPTSNNNLYSLIFQDTFASRIQGEKLFAKSLNGNSFDPLKEFALNPTAWEDPASGTFSGSPAYYRDYRFKRRPSEQVSFGRTFKVYENVQLNVRADFQNIFNKRELANPVYANAGATQVKDADGVPQSGFGYVDYRLAGGKPRSAMIVLKLQF